MPEGASLFRLVRTVRFRVTALATVAVVVVLAVGALTLVTLQRDALTSNLDDSLALHSIAIAGDVAAQTLLASLNTRGDEDTVAQVVSSQGRVVAASANLGRALRVSSLAAPRRGYVVRTVRVPGRAYEHRLIARRVALANGEIATLYLAAPLDDVTESISTLTRSMLTAVPLMAAILAALVWWLVGRALAPVERIRSQVGAMRGTDLDRRVPEPAGDDEIARLARTMNAMLGRIEESTQRQQRFVADASHELRTPLTRMRAELEVDLDHPDSADYVATERSVLDEVDALTQLTEDLLLLARADAGAVSSVAGEVELGELVLEEARRVGSQIDHVDTTAVEDARVYGHHSQLRRVVRNLLDNAVRYGRSRVVISLTQSAAGVVLEVTDDGPGIPPDAGEQIFERFTRLDSSRTTATGGSGLGLAIARDLVERAGGAVVSAPNPGSGARFVVTLPAV